MVAGLVFAATPVHSDSIIERADVWQHGVTYSAIAAGMQGSSFARGYAEQEKAREAAIEGCYEVYRTSCSVSTAEHSNWHFVAGTCDGKPYTAASPRSIQRAEAILISKAAHDGRSICTIYARH